MSEADWRNNYGTCNSIVTREYLANLLLNYADQLRIIEAKWTGEEIEHNFSTGTDYIVDNRYYVKVESKKLPDGYNGVMDIITNVYDIKFQKDCDV
jgi:hypothetical protein